MTEPSRGERGRWCMAAHPPRRHRRPIALGLLAVMAAGCASAAAELAAQSSSPPATSAATAADAPADASAADGPSVAFPAGVRAIVGTDGSVALDTGSGVSALAGRSLVSSDGSVVVQAIIVGATTAVRWIDTASGEVTSSLEIEGELEPVALDVEGTSVALVPPAGELVGDSIAAGRAQTEVVVAERGGETARFALAGNMVPEAFANWQAAGSRLPGAAYVVEFVPPLAPTHYKVRVLDLSTGTIGLPLNLRDKAQSVDQLMAGISRSAFLAARSGLLFTLYRGHHDEGHGSYAFIHTLGLGNGVWCLEVPPAMELSDRAGVMALDPSGERLVAVSANGLIAAIAIDTILDFEAVPVFGPTSDLGATTDAAPAIATGSTALWVGLGDQLIEVDPATLLPIGNTSLGFTIDALAVTGDDVVVAGDGRLVVVDRDLTVIAEHVLPGDLGAVARIVTG